MENNEYIEALKKLLAQLKKMRKVCDDLLEVISNDNGKPKS